jgi:teichuronic acid biosynthesis glycosyltransferase TuaG
MPAVSIIMSYYKKKEYLNKAINSILNQTFKKFEIILVDDEISKESIHLLNKIKKKSKKIKVIESVRNLGAGKARNLAINNSSGDYLAFCDCDDLWKKDKLKKQLNFMLKNNLDFSHTSYDIIDQDGLKIGLRKAKKNLSYNNLIDSCDIGLSTVIFKKKLFDNKNYKFPNLKTKEDYVLWLKFAKKGIKLNGINKYLTCWRSCSNSLSSNNFQKLLDGYKVYNIYLKFSKLQSIYKLLVLSINSIKKKYGRF